MNRMNFVGLDVHKKIIAFCVKEVDGTIIGSGVIPATRPALKEWVRELPQPWTGALEATLFTAWIYDFLKPHASALKVAHPEMLKAITSSKKKNDKIDAEKIADLLRCNLLPECHMVAKEYRDLRRVLRYRNLLVRQGTCMKNKISGLLMELGVVYNKQKLHGSRYFSHLLDTIEDIPESVLLMLRLSRANFEMLTGLQKKLINLLETDSLIKERVDRLMTIKGVGQVTALTWVLEIEDPNRFSSISRAVSYCGLCSAQKESAGKNMRGPISKKRNKHLQWVLIEAAKLAPRWNRQIKTFHERELEKGNKNRATLAVARKLVAYMLAVDKSKNDFVDRSVDAALI